MNSNNDQEIINELRKEAYQVKECAIQYFVRCTIFVTAFLGVILAFHKDNEYVLLCSILALLVLSASNKILLHKYGTANRNLGYELHLERSKHYKELYNSKLAWDDGFKNIGWEEAMRAWRIVQATVFEAICKKRYNKYKVDINQVEYPWFDIKKLIDAQEEVSYYAGSFLRKTSRILLYLMFISLFPLALFIQENTGDSIDISIGILAFVVGIAFIAHTWIYGHYRLKQLESGILSISSCSVTWHAVILAHFRALEMRKSYTPQKRTKKNGYAYNISVQAKRLAKEIIHIHDWIEGKWFRTSPRNTFPNPRLVESTEPTIIEFSVYDHSSDGMGLICKTKPELNEGDTLNFRENDMPSGKVAHITRLKDSEYLIGVRNLVSRVA
jgi:hypothetical protein